MSGERSGVMKWQEGDSAGVRRLEESKKGSGQKRKAERGQE